MTAEIINGSKLAKDLRLEIKNEVNKLKQKGLIPHLTVILVGDDPASKSYVKGKEKASKEVGIKSTVIRMSENTTEKELLNEINRLNNDDTVNGILVQLPLPNQIDEQTIIESIHPSKDVDGFHPANVGKMMLQQETFLPCTPHGIVKMLQAKNIDMTGKHVVVLGRSHIVGKPVGQLLLNKNATVTYCHSRTKNLKHHTKQADILIVAIGKEHMITADYVKDGAVVIDVGVNRTSKGTLTGDVAFNEVKEKASFITPVPKGVGPMTITMLLHNTVKATKGLSF